MLMYTVDIWISIYLYIYLLTDFLSTCTTLSPLHYPVDDPSATKEASIFNLFRERGMLGGPATGSPGNAGNAPAGVYNPLTFKVEPAPEQNIRNILLSNQHTVVSHDAHAFVDESDYTAQYGASGTRGSRYVVHAEAEVGNIGDAAAAHAFTE